MSKGGRRRRVSQVVRRHVNGLEGGDRACLRGGNAFLKNAHFLGERWLVTHGRRHTAQQRGNLGARQRVTVNVIDEHQHVATFIAEILRHGQARQRYAQTVAGRLVHLAVDQRHLVDNA